MIYQVRANMFFEKEDKALDFYHACQKAMPKTTMVNPDSENKEKSLAEYMLCYHNENPAEPCELIAFEAND